VELEALHAAVQRAAELGRLRREVGVLRARQGDEARAAAAAISDQLERLIDLAARNPDAPVLLVGETGTGKGFVARQIHERSAQHAEPFIEINCASLAPPFFESELFGHERGAFTDARQAKRGLLEVAGRGTVFLDEIGEMAPDAQPRLLKALEERSFRRLGGTTTLHTTARLLAATNQPLAERVAAGRFRADLFYRLQVLTIALPPLRESPTQIVPLALSLLPDGATLAPAARRALEGYAWPGNIRELKNTLWRAALLAHGAPIEPAHLGLPAAADAAAPGPLTLVEAERRAIAEALRATGGNKARAAELLGIARSTLMEKLRRQAP